MGIYICRECDDIAYRNLLCNISRRAPEFVDRILKELKGRRGFRHLLEEIELEDKEIYDEIKQALIEIVKGIC